MKTDGAGRYEVSGLPAGRYVVAASKTNYVTTSFNSQRVLGPGKAFELADGQTIANVNFALPRAGVITGQVLDEFGDPATGVQVMTARMQYVTGERGARVGRQRGFRVDSGWRDP